MRFIGELTAGKDTADKYTGDTHPMIINAEVTVVLCTFHFPVSFLSKVVAFHLYGMSVCSVGCHSGRNDIVMLCTGEHAHTQSAHTPQLHVKT